MIAKMAAVDLARLRAAGYQPTDDDVVRLNDLAVRIERGKDATVVNAPRVAMAGNVAVYEPTIAAIEWYHSFGRDASWTTRGQLDAYYFMLAHANDPDTLDALTDPRAIRRAVRAWKRTVYATEGELWRALLYVRRADECDEQATDPAKIDPLAENDARERIYRQLIAASGALGVSPSSLRCETPTTLVALLVEANLHARIPMKASVAREYIAYQQLVREIESRGKTSSSDNG